MADSQSDEQGVAAYTAVPLAAAAGLLGLILLFGGLLGFVCGAYGLAVTRDITLASCAASALAALPYSRAQRQRPSNKRMDPPALGG